MTIETKSRFGYYGLLELNIQVYYLSPDSSVSHFNIYLVHCFGNDRNLKKNSKGQLISKLTKKPTKFL